MANCKNSEEVIVDITKPLWDQSTFVGRFRHFAYISNPFSSFVKDEELFKAKELYIQHQQGTHPPGTSRDQLVRAKQLYESAFHPDSGELQNVFGRMSFQLPGGMIITGALLQFYRTTTGIVFWQWVNQSFNALVNYTNRNAKSPLTTNQMAVAYVSATGAALSTALTFKFVVQKRAKNPIFARFVPFVAVMAANCVNIPLMRQSEIINGIQVSDENGNVVGKSRTAPVKGIAQVISSRIVMCSPGMVLLPLIMERLEQRPWMKRMAWSHVFIQTFIVGCFLSFMVPAACALYPQRSKISTETIKRHERENYDEIVKNTNGNVPEYVYFNKGL